MLLFSFPACSLKQLENLNALIADWGHTTEDWVEYMLTWRDEILEYEDRCAVDVNNQQGPVYEHFWHGQQWKIPKRYEEQSKQLAHLIGKKGQVILEVFDMMEEWIERELEAKFHSTREIKVLFRKAEHLAFLVKGEINKEWRRLEESEKPVETQTTVKKKKGPKLPAINQTQIKILGRTKESQQINEMIIILSKEKLSDQVIKNEIDKKFPDSLISLDAIKSRRLKLKKSSLM